MGCLGEVEQLILFSVLESEDRACGVAGRSMAGALIPMLIEMAEG